MLKVVFRDTIFLGLTTENITRLMDNQPIVIDGKEVLLPGLKIVILGENTLEDVKESLRCIGVPIPNA
jgi:hypothetical protein